MRGGNHAPNVARHSIERTLRDAMRQFDALPLIHRAAVRNAAYNIDVAGLETVSVQAVRDALDQIQRASVRATYGADHPQAGG